MKTKLLRSFILGTILLLSAANLIAQVTKDSLSLYLEVAARNNPQVNSDFMLYKASLEKIPQAGAYQDPEIDIGYYLKPMDIIGGKQVADITVMQMFPWFGTRKAARHEAGEMARMSYEKFRETRNNLWYEVKSQWYQLSNLNEQYKTTQANIILLKQLEQLALNRFSASSAQGSASAGRSTPSPMASATPSPASSGGMSSMSGMGGGSASTSKGGTTSAASASSSGMGNMGGGSMGGSSMSGGTGGMSDVLRIQMERAELENNLKNIRSARIMAEAKFNTLLNRKSDAMVTVPDSLIQRVFSINEQSILDSIFSRNPMLTMIDAEGDAYRAKAKMDKRMSYPMIGVGFQYMLVNKTKNPMTMPDMNGMDMVMPMLKLSLPLYRSKYNAQQRESKNYWLASELKRENVQNQLSAEFVTIRQQLEDAARKVELYTNQYELSVSTWQLIVREFSAGRQSLTDVIQVERQMLDYNLKKSEAVAEYNTTVAGIEKLISTSH